MSTKDPRFHSASFSNFMHSCPWGHLWSWCSKISFLLHPSFWVLWFIVYSFLRTVKNTFLMKYPHFRSFSTVSAFEFRWSQENPLLPVFLVIQGKVTFPVSPPLLPFLMNSLKKLWIFKKAYIQSYALTFARKIHCMGSKIKVQATFTEILMKCQDIC
jgi:hypothetical protein